MILPWLIKLALCLVGLALSIVAVVAVCYVAFELLSELSKEDDNVANK